MIRQKLICSTLVSVLLAGGVTVSLLAQTPLPPLPDGASGAEETEFYSEDDAEALNRGAIHEAFATPVDNEPVVGLIVNRQPPDPIDEVPPELKPEGENIVWISGYFSFDEELDDFVWISGMWRDVPPGRTWVPGYWHEIEGGWQWVHGYWADETADEIVYQPEPPASQEYGPSSPSPGDNYFYIPGSWVYVNYNYNWRPGYWAPYQPNWIWVPARYIFTPRGYVYIPGYWDYLLRYRGVAYAPIHFHRYGLRRRYRPIVLIDSWEYLVLHLFVRPRFGYYAFGNYYGNRYNNFYQPWYAYHRSRGGYDPLYAHFHIRYGDDGYNRLVGWNRYFHNHSEYRPRTTYREQRTFLIQNRETVDSSILAATSLASNLETIQKSPKTPVSFRKMELAEQAAITKSIQDIRKVSLQRTQLEGRTKGFGSAKIQKSETQKFEIPKLVQQQRIPGVTDRISNRKGPAAKSGDPSLTGRTPPELPTILGNRGQAGRTLPGRSSNTVTGEGTEPSTRDPKRPSTRTPIGNRTPRTTETKPNFPRRNSDTTTKPEPKTTLPTPRVTPRTPTNPKTERPQKSTPPSRTPAKPNEPTIRNRTNPGSSSQPTTPTIIPPERQKPRSNSSSSSNRTPPIQRSTNSKKPESPAIPKRSAPSPSTQPRAPSIKLPERKPSTNSPSSSRRPIPNTTSQPKAPSIKLPERKPSSNSSSSSQNRTPPVQRSTKSIKPTIQTPSKQPSPTPKPAKKPSPPPKSSSSTIKRIQSSSARSSFSKPSAPRQAPQIKQPSPKTKSSSRNDFRQSSASRNTLSKRSVPQPKPSAPPKTSSSRSKAPSSLRSASQRSRKKD